MYFKQHYYDPTLYKNKKIYYNNDGKHDNYMNDNENVY